MKKKRFGAAVCLSIAWAFALPQPAHAITIILKRSNQPIRGFVVLESEDQIIVRVPAANGTSSEQTIAKSDIDLVHRPVSAERLAALHPDRPKEYRDYAEELAEKRIDPEAREMGLRLYVIAAFLDPESLGRSSLLGMTALAPTPADERRYRALAYLLDPDHDRSVLKDTVSVSSDASAGGADTIDLQRATLLRGLELLRKGRTQEAATQFRREGVAEAYAPYADILSFDELINECRSRQRRGPAARPELAAKILQLELRILGEPEPSGSVDVSAPSWAGLPPAALNQPIRPLEIRTITDFDPALCVYRDGKWVAP